MGNAIWETQKNYSDPTTPPPLATYMQPVSLPSTPLPPPGVGIEPVTSGGEVALRSLPVPSLLCRALPIFKTFM